ncbi:MAG: hypothetical protein FWF53_05080 [Candidatus Azobacteroides sp.]|nr:hypothetical protein [Candidatus Azobacteroides sp.]
MKYFNLFLTGSLSVIMFACQSETEYITDYEIPDYEISGKDAVKKFSDTPNGVIYVETTNQSVKIDFSCTEEMTFETSNQHFILLRNGRPVINSPVYSYTDFGKDIEYALQDHVSDEMKLDTVRTIGQLAAVYKGFGQHFPDFEWEWSSAYYPFTDANHIYSTIEYLLAQACFQDDCSSSTRKAVLKMAVEKQTYKFEEYKNSYMARRAGIFLMTTIMVKEMDFTFLTAVQKNRDLQNALCLMADDLPIDEEFSNFVRNFATNYLLNR